MAIKTVCVVFVAIAIASTLGTGVGNVGPSTDPDATSSDNAQSGVGYLRSGRQLYPGFGGGNAFSSASAFSGSNGFGYPFGGGFSGAQASASSGSFGGK